MGLFSKNEPQAETYEINDKPVICHNCQNDTFWIRTAQLNTAMATLFNVDWANKSATCLVCSECSYIHWFLLDKKELKEGSED